MKKTNNIWENTSKFLTIMIISLIFVGCSTNGGDTGGNNDGVYTSAWDGTASEEPSKSGSVYIITEAKHLAWLAEQDTATAIRFDANIDMGSKLFTGIKSFTGIMDGNNKSIKNLTIEDGGNTGLILLIPSGSTAEIKNLTIESGSIKGSMAGAFIAESYGTVTLTGLINKATVTGTFGSRAGGMIGAANNKVTINNAQNTGAINGGSGKSTAGGMIGQAIDSTVTINNANNTGVISSGDNSGGMIGWANRTSTVNIKNAKNTGAISGDSTAGGMIGYSEKEVTIENSHSYQAQKLVGTGTPTPTITASYYLTTSADNDAQTLTAVEFKIQAKFAGWNFGTIWKKGANYPELR